MTNSRRTSCGPVVKKHYSGPHWACYRTALPLQYKWQLVGVGWKHTEGRNLLVTWVGENLCSCFLWPNFGDVC